MQKGKKSYTRRRKASRKTKRRQTRSSKRTYRNKRGGEPDDMIVAKPAFLQHVREFLPFWKERRVKWLTDERSKLIDTGLQEGKLPEFLIEQLNKLPVTAFSYNHTKMNDLTALQRWAEKKQPQETKQKYGEPASEETSWDSDVAAFESKLESM